MKRLIRAGICAAAVIITASCANKHDTSAETSMATETSQTESAAVFESKPQEKLNDEASITLGNYRDLILTARKGSVTDEQVEGELSALLLRYPPEVTGRAAQNGDIANIDFVGTKDGVAFNGGTAEKFDLELGSGGFIAGFEEGVVGMQPGEEKDLNLTFPEDYDNVDLAGQAVVFHVTLNAIKDPSAGSVDDSLAVRVLGDESATLETLKEHVRENLEFEMENIYFNAAGGELLSQAIANAEIVCDPDAVEEMNEQLRNTYSSRAAQYGLELDDFLKMFLSTDAEGLRENAEELVKQEMTLNEIIRQENLAATDEQKEKLARMNYFESAQEMINLYGEEAADNVFRLGAAYFYLIDHAKTAEPEEAATTAVQP